MVGWALVISIVVVMAVLLIGLWFHQQRQGEVEAYAAQHGLVSTDAPWALVQLVGEGCSIGGRAHDMRYVLMDPAPRDLGGRQASASGGGGSALDHTMFGQFCYKTGGGDSETRHTRGVFYYPLPATFPPTRIKPEGILSPMLGDIKTEWDEFNRAFEVTSASDRFASAMLYPRMQEFLMERLSGLQLDLVPGGLVLLAGEWRVEDYQPLHAIASEFEERMLPYLWKEFG